MSITPLVLAMSARESCLSEVVEGCWSKYAAERFGIGSKREQSAHRELAAKIAAQHERMRGQAKRMAAQLGFSRARLEILAIKSLDRECAFCAELFGVENFGVVWDVEPCALHLELFAMTNVVVCCELCAKGKGDLTGAAWLELLAALRIADAPAARRTREAVAIGRAAADGRREGERYFRGGAAAKVTRSVPLGSSKHAKK